MASLYRFSTRVQGGQPRVDREARVDWAQQRFGVDLAVDDLKSKQRAEIYDLILKVSQKDQEKAGEISSELESKILKIFSGNQDQQAIAGQSSSNGALTSLSHWLDENLNCRISAEEMAPLTREELEA